jgi:hypothetical protein
MTQDKREWEDDFEDYWYERGKYRDRELGIKGYIEFIKRIEDKAKAEEFEKGFQEGRVR